MQKWGKKRGKQNYKCQKCGYSFQNKSREGKEASNQIKQVYHDYAVGRKTLEMICMELGISIKTLQKAFDAHEPVLGEIVPPKHVVTFIMDATFFSRRDGILVFRANKKNILWKEIQTEKVEHYRELIQMAYAADIKISAFVIDGKRGVLQMLLRQFTGIPVQLCQFHQIQTITHYLSKKPKLEAGKELRHLTLTLTKSSQKTFTGDLGLWYERWKDFLNEKTLNPYTHRYYFTHKRLRSAHRSLRTNLPWLFTYLNFPELNIPNTTNSCDGSFAHWKGRLMVHRGLRRDRRKKMINYLLEHS